MRGAASLRRSRPATTSKVGYSCAFTKVVQDADGKVVGAVMDWLRDHGAIVVQADALEKLASKVQSEIVSGDKFNADGFLRIAAEWNDADADAAALEGAQ